MLHVSLTLSQIDYEGALTALYPKLSGLLSALRPGHIALRALRELGDDAAPLAAAVLRRVPEKTKNGLLVSALSAYAPKLTEKTNALLRAKLGDALRLGALACRESGEGIRLDVYGIEPDYRALLQSELVRGLMEKQLGGMGAAVGRLGGLGFRLAPELLEKTALDILARSDMRQKLLRAADGALRRHGLRLTLGELWIERSAAAPERTGEGGFRLSQAQEQALLEAGIGYLRDTLKD